MSASGWPSTLPQPLSTFVGRASERNQVATALCATRLLVLTGAAARARVRARWSAACRWRRHASLREVVVRRPLEAPRRISSG